MTTNRIERLEGALRQRIAATKANPHASAEEVRQARLAEHVLNGATVGQAEQLERDRVSLERCSPEERQLLAKCSEPEPIRVTPAQAEARVRELDAQLAAMGVAR